MTPQNPRPDSALTRRVLLLGAAAVPLTQLAACAQAPALAGPSATVSPPSAPAAPRPPLPPEQAYRWLDRLSWGATSTLMAQFGGRAPEDYVESQLTGPLSSTRAPLPPEAQAQVAALTVSQRPLEAIVADFEAQRKAADAIDDPERKKAAQQDYQQALTRLAREPAVRHVLRALYSPAQVREQMTWFWLNHFSVFLYKSNIRVLLADYEDHAIRDHALGRFRDLLGAVVHHPAMLRYLDNDQNAGGRINENFARELMELHTLGVDAGYSQRDVQELARVLTGLGVNMTPPSDPKAMPRLKPEQQALYVRRGFMEFNPARHDFGPKQLLGEPIRAHGFAEIDEALDRLARQPATARFLSRKLAQYWLADEPPPALVDRMAQRFAQSDGDIAQVLRTLFLSPEFARGGGRRFKDPMRYVVSAVRLAYDDKVILNANPILGWLSRMGEPLYGRQTPDGYSLFESAWASPGQMSTRFEIAKSLGSGSAGLFKSEGPNPQERPAFPQLSNALYFQAIRGTLSDATRRALDQAASPQEWNTFLLSSPEMMVR